MKRFVRIFIRKFSYLLGSLLACAFLTVSAAAQNPPQSSDKTPGTHNPAAEAGSGLPQAGSTSAPGKAAAGTPATADNPSTAANAKPTEPDPFLDVPPLPTGNVTLVGGIVRSIDPIRNRMTVEPFGGHSMKVVFDERSHIYRDGIETTFLGIHKGDRVYVDTQLDHSAVFARNVHVVTEMHAADARGQIIAYRDGAMTIRDDLSGQPVSFRVAPSTAVKRQGAGGSQADLVPGALVTVEFAPGKADRGEARAVSIVAKPGSEFTFYGELMHLDMSRGTMAVHNIADDRTYDLQFSRVVAPDLNNLRIGAQVVVKATFTGQGYRASSVAATQARVAPPAN